MLAQADGGHDIAVDDAGSRAGGLAEHVGAAQTFTDTIYSTCPVAPPVQVLDGGWVLSPPERAARVACLMEICDVDRTRRAKEQETAPAPNSWLVTAGAAVSAAIAAYSLARNLPR